MRNQKHMHVRYIFADRWVDSGLLIKNSSFHYFSIDQAFSKILDWLSPSLDYKYLFTLREIYNFSSNFCFIELKYEDN